MLSSAVVNDLVFIVEFILKSFIHIWPYLVLSILIAVLVRTWDFPKRITKILSASPMLAILGATVFGALSPLCSCSVIPVVSTLLLSGVPLAPVMAFWLASPSMDPEIFFLSVGMIGWKLAIWRMAATFVMSFSAGMITHWLISRKFFGESYLTIAKQKRSCGCSCNDSCSSEPKKIHSHWREVLNNTRVVAVFIVKYMIIAYILEALIELYIPSGWIVGLLGTQSRFAIELATMIGIPVYTTNLSALGIVKGLLAQGMNPAAALAFLIAGATTTIPAMAAVYGIATKKVFCVYLGMSVVSALAFGYLYQLVEMIF